MRRLRFETVALAFVLATGATTSVLAANDAAKAGAPGHLEMTDDGQLLLTPDGKTLYVYGPDAQGRGKSTCGNVPRTKWRDGQAEFGQLPVVRPDAHKSCIQKWPAYLADANAQPSEEFGLIDRTEGGKQWTWRGKPLYFSVKDQKAGDRFGATFQGDNRGRGWSFASVPPRIPGSLRVVRFDDGQVVATENGRPVYTPKSKAAEACQGCEEVFKPITAPDIGKVSGDWSIVHIGDRAQYAFKGKPIYAAPDSMKEWEIAEEGGWEPVYFRKGPGRPPEIQTRVALIGEVYANKDGQTLYTFGCGTPANDGVACNDPGDPAGYWVALCGVAEECAKRWKPYRAAEGARSQGEWSVVDVAYPMFTDPRGFTYPPEAPRVKAWAYRGQPVYTYYEDTKPGDVWGEAIAWLGFSRFNAARIPGRQE